MEVNFAGALKETIYVTVQEGVKDAEKVARKHAQNLCEKIKADSPRRGDDVEEDEHYADGWEVSKSKEAHKSFAYTVGNKTKGSLTHLLENGHITANGTRTKPIPHIKKNEDAEMQAFIDDMQNLEWGGK